MLEKWELEVDNNEAFRALLTDLSKVFDCLSHNLRIARLHGLSLTRFSPVSDFYTP